MMQYIFILIFISLICMILFLSIIDTKKIEHWTYIDNLHYAKIGAKMGIANKKHLNICVVSYDNRKSDDILKLKNINEQYCKLHNYTFLFFDNYDNNTISPYWVKVKIVYDILKTNKYDIIMWMDSDACFNNFNIKIENLFNNYDNKSFIICGDNVNVCNFPLDCSNFNAGVWIVKNNNIVKQFFSDWMDKYNSVKKYWNNDNGKWTCIDTDLKPCKWAGSYYEQQTGEQLLLNYPYNMFVIYLQPKLLQGTLQNVKTSYVLHFASQHKKDIHKYLDLKKSF